MAGNEELAARIQVLEDIEDIRRIKSLYCRICDCGWDKPGPAGISLKDIFTVDGVWDNGVSIIKIHESKRRQSGSPFKMGVHYSINGSIEVNGDVGKGWWHGLIPLTTPDGEARWCAGIYEEDYQRTPTGWKYKKMKFHPAFMSPHKEGWAEKTMRSAEDLVRHARWLEE